MPPLAAVKSQAPSPSPPQSLVPSHGGLGLFLCLFLSSSFSLLHALLAHFSLLNSRLHPSCSGSLAFPQMALPCNLSLGVGCCLPRTTAHCFPALSPSRVSPRHAGRLGACGIPASSLASTAHLINKLGPAFPSLGLWTLPRATHEDEGSAGTLNQSHLEGVRCGASFLLWRWSPSGAPTPSTCSWLLRCPLPLPPFLLSSSNPRMMMDSPASVRDRKLGPYTQINMQVSLLSHLT